MVAASRWIKWLLAAAVVIAMASMWLILKASKAEQAALRARLDAAKQANQTSQATIETLKHDQQYLNQLLVSRAQKNQQDRRQLNEQIDQLEQQMANVECDIPAAVTERLREPY